jgi:hypothetical protein
MQLEIGNVYNKSGSDLAETKFRNLLNRESESRRAWCKNDYRFCVIEILCELRRKVFVADGSPQVYDRAA